MKIGGVGSPFGSGIVDQIMEAEKAPIKIAEARREKVVQEKNEFNSLNGILGELGKSLDGLKSPATFAKLKVESSHPDILEGSLTGLAEIGSYEFAVNGLAKADKMLAEGFGDVDKTAVGFGFMGIEREDGGMTDLTIKPGSTLQDVANQINASAAGVKAQIINTGAKEDPFQLLVSSEITGEAAKIHLDPDTTFLNFKNQVAGRDLDVTFEDVNIKRAGNEMNDLLSGLQLKAKRAEPGTMVQVNVGHDVDATMTGIKAFTEKYNSVVNFVGQQYQKNPETGKPSALAGDSSIRTTMRALQSQVANGGDATKEFGTLAAVGITTNAKTGALDVDDGKLKAALAKDYDGVMGLFARTESGEGVAERLSKAVKGLQNRETGAMSTRTRALDQIIKSQDEAIAKQTDRLETKKAHLARTFSNLDSKMATLNSQGEFLSAHFAGPSGAAAAPASAGPEAKSQ